MCGEAVWRYYEVVLRVVVLKMGAGSGLKSLAKVRMWRLVAAAALLAVTLVAVCGKSFAQPVCPRMDYKTQAGVCPECPPPEPTYAPQPPTIEECFQAGVCPLPTAPAQAIQDPTCTNLTATQFMQSCPRGTALRAGVAGCCPTDQLVGDGAEFGYTASAPGVLCCVSDPAPTPTPNPISTPTGCQYGLEVFTCQGRDYCCKPPDGICWNGNPDPIQGLTGYEGPYCYSSGLVQWNCSAPFACEPMSATPTPTPIPTSTPIASGGGSLGVCTVSQTSVCSNVLADFEGDAGPQGYASRSTQCNANPNCSIITLVYNDGRSTPGQCCRPETGDPCACTQRGEQSLNSCQVGTCLDSALGWCCADPSGNVTKCCVGAGK